MNILVAASEAVPFAKTGGLADVAGALPRAVEALGHAASVVMPCHAEARRGCAIAPTEFRVHVPLGKKQVAGDVYRATLPASDVTVYLIDQPDYFGRDGLYG